MSIDTSVDKYLHLALYVFIARLREYDPLLDDWLEPALFQGTHRRDFVAAKSPVQQDK